LFNQIVFALFCVQINSWLFKSRW